MEIKSKMIDYSGWRRHSSLLACLFFFAICFTVYFNALNNNFIFDDDFLIVKNLYIKNIYLIPRLFQTDIFHFQHPEDPLLGDYYRPLQALSYVFDYFFWRLNPAGYRIINILIHSANAFLLYLLICLIFKDRRLALVSAIFFSLHPIQVSGVAFISVRAVPMTLFFMLLSMITLMKYFLHERGINYILSICSFILALLSWEFALLLPIFVMLCAFSVDVNKRKLSYCFSSFILIAIAYLVLRHQFLPCDKLYLTDIFSIKKLKDFFYYLHEYFQQFILPVGSQKLIFGNSAIYKFILSVFSLGITTYLLIKAVIFKDKIVSFGVIFYFIGLLPIIKLTDKIPLFGPVLSEHYAYIASAGFFILISYLTIEFCRYFRKIALICFTGIIAAYSVLTVINNANYKDNITFYEHILNVDKNHKLLRINLGTVYYEKKMYAKAIGQANLVLAWRPNAWDAYLLLGNVFKSEGDINKAIEFYKKAIAINPRASEAFNNLALIYREQGRDSEALEHFRQAIKINPEATWALQNLADFLIDKGIYDEAATICERILKLNPDDVNCRVSIGIILAKLNRTKESEAVFQEALKLDPNSIEAMKNLGALYGNAGNFDRAISLWEKVLSINPSDAEIKNNVEKAKELRRLLSQ